MVVSEGGGRKAKRVPPKGKGKRVEIEEEIEEDEELVEETDEIEEEEDDELDEVDTQVEPAKPQVRYVPKMRPYVDVPRQRTVPITAPVTQIPSKEAEIVTPKKVSRPRVTLQDREHVLEMLAEIFKMVYPITIADLLTVSPRTRAMASELIRKNKVSPPANAIHSIKEVLLVELQDINTELGLGFDVFLDDLARLEEGKPGEQKITEKPSESENISIFLQDLPDAQYYVSDGTGEVPRGGIICPDPVDVYLTSNTGNLVKGNIVANSSERIRVFYPRINENGREESIFDDGSQVCSVSEKTAQKLGINWDPDLRIGLQSSNRSTAETLGLARNVPVDCGNGVHVYVQFHVVKDAAYKVLLGRPFLSATSAQASNQIDGTHTITLTDPNTLKRVTVTSFERGAIPERYRAEMAIPFQASRI